MVLVGQHDHRSDRTGSPPRLELPHSDMVDRLASILLEAWRSKGDRIIIGVCGAPGAGKSSLAAALAARLGADLSVVVPFDGFHLATTVLEGTPLLQRRGALETFDLGAFRSLVSRLRARDDDIVYAPSFVRGLEEPIASAIPVPRSVPIIITEGNYLLSPHPILRDVRDQLDEVWYLDTPPEIRLPQLIARHVAFGKPEEEAQEWVAGTDQRNADQVESTRDSADLVITVTP